MKHWIYKLKIDKQYAIMDAIANDISDDIDIYVWEALEAINEEEAIEEYEIEGEDYEVTIDETE